MAPNFHFRKGDERVLRIDGGYTQRQLDIMDGTAKTPLGLNEINRLIQKAEARGDNDLAMEIYERYEEQITGNEKPKYTIEKAKAVMQSLTPWEIHWD